MNSVRKWWVGAVGAVVLAAIIGAGIVSAQTPSTSTTPTASSTVTTSPTVVPGTPSGSNMAPGAPGSATGTFKSNEDPAHEAAESAEWEAQEDAGVRPTGPRSGGVPMTPGSVQTPTSTN